MQYSTREFLKNYLSDEQKDLLAWDPDRLRDSMSKETDEQRFEKAAEQYKNPRLLLLAAVHKAETHPDHETIRQVIQCAVKQDDFVTALHWHQKQLSGKTVKVSDKFERYYYTLMAERQKQQEPKAEPCTGVQQMCQKSSDTSHALRDPQYLEHSITYRTQLVKTTQEKFDAAEQSVFLPTKKKDDNATWIQLLIGLVFLVLGGVFLWKTYGVVAAAVNSFFRYSILSLICWVLHVAYAILVIVLVCVLIWLFTKNIGSNSKKKLKNTLCEIKYQVERSLEDSEAYLALQAMNKDLPSAFCSYDARLVLAALSAMSGERDVKRLCDMANREEPTWLTRLMPPEKYASKPYETKINSLIRENAPDSDLFLGFTLAWKQDNRSLYNNLILVFPDPVSDRAKGRILFGMAERFLLDETLIAEKQSKSTRTGEAYYWLYRLYVGSASTLFSDSVIYRKAYQYGSLGVSYSDELKYYVMHTYACRKDYTNPYLTLGFFRADTENYADELTAKGDPRGKELWERIKEADRRAAEHAAEAEAAEAEAFWAEKSRLMREAEAEREKARAELNDKMDRMEREANLYFRGDYSTEEERTLRGEQSELDGIRHQNLRDAVIRKKLDDM